MNDELRFHLGDKAEKLYFSVFDETNNRNHFPVKFRRLADRMQEYALDIHSDLLDANAYRTDISYQKVKRNELLTSAITKCNKLMSLVKYCVYAQRISFARSEEWTKLVNEIKYMSLSLRSK